MPVAIEWQAPAPCPDASQVRAAIDAMVSPVRSSSTALVARGIVSQAPGERGFTLRMSIEATGGSETKAIDADSCATLADAFAIVAAFAIDPSASPRAPFADRERARAAAPVPPRPVPLDETRASWERSDATSLAVGPLLATGAGLLPLPAFGLGAGVALEHGVRWELSGFYWPDEVSSVTGAGLANPARSYGANVRLLSVQSGVCLPLGAGTVAACAAAQLGAMSADGAGTGVSAPTSGRSWWLAPILGAALRLRIVRTLDLRFRIDAGLPVFRPSFVLLNVGPPQPVEAFRPAPFFGVLSVELEFRFFSTDSSEGRHVHP